ncbi:hypothetical protein U9M48_038597 [Paspalum notatum var. saurae]|uniref:Uncharacterized protein n=1 Tax=Paspalum notatum var. saurae TaxID=547442 RepID=A0AAQ3XC80_PASNO
MKPPLPLKMQSFNHRVDKRALVRNDPNGADSQTPEPKKVRGRNKMHRPRNRRIAIIPEGDNQFRYANYSVDDKMKKGPILGVILKQEYPPLIEGTSRIGQQFQYHASKWEHYYHIVRDDGQTQVDRVKEEFWRGTVDGSSHASANLVTNSDGH